MRKRIREGIASVYLNNILFGSNLQEIVQNSIMLNLPRWYKDGLISYFGEEWSHEYDLKLREAFKNKKYRNFEKLAVHQLRLAGQMFWNYIGFNYGKNSIGNLLYVTRINRNLRARDARLASLRQQSVEEDHIVRLGLLASGAAHELGTPLATLSVILNDWQHIPEINDSSEFSQELREMQSQLDRCKTIVSGILMSSGEARGEGTVRATVNEFMDGLIAEWRSSRSPKYFDYTNKFDPDMEIVSDTALKQVIFNLLDNAYEASPGLVGVHVSRVDNALVVTVDDRGPGFAPDMLAEFGKPYRSSKGRPGGGLGLFLVVNVARKLGGVVTAKNAEIGGAEVTLTLPVASLSPEEKSDVG